jgi:hypothetical protein
VVTRSDRAGGRVQTQAHRYAWELLGHKIPPGKFLLHKCDNPPCCNPDHLYVGGYKENGRDVSERQRGTWGENNWTSKLKIADVLHIRSMQGKARAVDLAKQYGVIPNHISNIWGRRVWASLRSSSTRSHDEQR